MLRPPRELEPDPGDTSDSDGSTEGTESTVCPLCGVAAEDPTDVYTHLQVGHRKSELARAIIDW